MSTLTALIDSCIHDRVTMMCLTAKDVLRYFVSAVKSSHISLMTSPLFDGVLSLCMERTMLHAEVSSVNLILRVLLLCRGESCAAVLLLQ